MGLCHLWALCVAIKGSEAVKGVPLHNVKESRYVGFAEDLVQGLRVYPDGRTTTVPFHAGRDIARPLPREILKDIELSADDLIAELDKL